MPYCRQKAHENQPWNANTPAALESGNVRFGGKQETIFTMSTGQCTQSFSQPSREASAKYTQTGTCLVVAPTVSLSSVLHLFTIVSFTLVILSSIINE